MPKIVTLALFAFAVASACGQQTNRNTRHAQEANPPTLQAAFPEPSHSPNFHHEANGERGSKVNPLWVSLPQRDFTDWIAYAANLILVAVGIGGVLVAVTTLKKIERQTKASENQLGIQRETLRPRLNVSNIINNTFTEAIAAHRVVVKLNISNSGGMPAYNVGVETWIEFIEREPTERPFQFSENAKYDKGVTINVDTGHPQGFEIPLNRRLNETEIFQMQHAEGTICFRIRLTYLAFDKNCHFDHAFAITPDAAQSIIEYTSAD